MSNEQEDKAETSNVESTIKDNSDSKQEEEEIEAQVSQSDIDRKEKILGSRGKKTNLYWNEKKRYI